MQIKWQKCYLLCTKVVPSNENNETEIIEAEKVDTGKIDWDW